MARNDIGVDFAVCFSLLASLFACSTPGAFDPPQKKMHQVSVVLYDALRYRRPFHAAAEGDASPGGVEFRTVERADLQTLDCITPETLLGQPPTAGAITPKRVKECFDSIQSPVEVHWRLKREVQPFWELIVEEGPIEEGGTPACIKELFSVLPLPREIIFEGMSRENLRSCFSSSPDWERDRLWGFKLPFWSRQDLIVAFPFDFEGLGETPEGRLESLLASWTLAPFLVPDEAEKRFIPAVIVPDALCSRCVGKEVMTRLRDPKRPPGRAWSVK